MRVPGKGRGNRVHPHCLPHDFFKTPKGAGKLIDLQGRTISFPNRQRVLIIEDDASTRTMLFAFLTSMRCECVATACRAALAILKRKEFEAVLLDFGPSKSSAKHFLSKMQDLRPDLMGKSLVIAGDGGDAPAIQVVESYALPHISKSRLFQQLWSNLQPLLSGPGTFESPRARLASLVFDGFRPQSSRGIRATPHTARHLIYKCEEVFIDLLIGPLSTAGRVELAGQGAGDLPGKVSPAHLPVVLVNPHGPIAYSGTNRRGEFKIEFGPEDDLALRIRVAPDFWIETPLRDMAWAIKRLARLSA